MHSAIRIYQCRCGQYTPVDKSAQVPVCSRCGGPSFKQVLWFQNNQHGGATWMSADYQPETESSHQANSEPSAVQLATDATEDEDGARLNVGLARALLKYLEILKRDDGISDKHYEIETQRVLRRVIRELRELHALGEM